MAQTSSRQAKWPALQFEPHHWYPSAPDALPRRQMQANTGTYQAAIPPQIAERPVPIPVELATDAEAAAVEIGRFDVEATEAAEV